MSFMSFCFSNAKLRRASQKNVALFYNYVAYSYGICARRDMCECMRLRNAVPATAFCGGAPHAAAGGCTWPAVPQRGVVEAVCYLMGGERDLFFV